MNKLKFLASSILMGLLAIGCGNKGPSVVPVSGTVTHSGKPVPNLFINFEPESGRPSWAVSDEQGKFVAKYDSTQDGMVTAKHKVWFQWRPRDPKDQMIEQGFAKGKSSKTAEVKEILKKYGNRDNPEVSIEIKQATPNLEIKLD
jgi:predicted small lipoprotein YifL